MHKYASKILKLSLIVIALGLFLFSLQSSALKTEVFAETSSDAIAVRVIPNPDHVSVSRWYYEQRFTGSPQALIIDGYEAIKDGRTVYVNAANVVNGVLYTNIYLISFNQDVAAATTAIFDQIIKHWKFNTNLPKGKTMDASPVDASCSEDNSENPIICLTDDDCTGMGYCDSAKAQVIRDTHRLSRMNDIDTLIEQYKDNPENGRYPVLTAGTYAAGATISVWPSWQETLGEILGRSLPVDPINSLLACPGYDETTCWDETDKIFAHQGDIDSGTLSDGNNVFMYKTDADGFSKILCTFSETTMITGNMKCNEGCAPEFPNCAAITCNTTFCNTGCEIVPGTMCCDTSWAPAALPNTVCHTETIIETSNCGNTRNILSGTMCCGDDAGGYHQVGSACISNTEYGGFIADAASTVRHWDQSLNSGNGAWEDWQVVSCIADHHQVGNTCASNTITGCSIANAATTIQHWDQTSGAWGACQVVTCNSAYHQAGNACVSNTSVGSCSIANAASTVQYWDESSGTWGLCQATACEGDYYVNNGVCDLKCGNGSVDAGEVCEPGDTSSCPSIIDLGLPGYCGAVTVEGTAECKSDCSGWETCVSEAPTIVNNSATGCSSTDVALTDYVCCELVSCSQDGCACGGREGGAETPAGYATIASMTPVWDSSQTLGPGYETYTTFNTTGAIRADSPYAGSCKLNQSNTNSNNWQITTEHSTAYYRCWR